MNKTINPLTALLTTIDSRMLTLMSMMSPKRVVKNTTGADVTVDNGVLVSGSGFVRVADVGEPSGEFNVNLKGWKNPDGECIIVTVSADGAWMFALKQYGPLRFTAWPFKQHIPIQYIPCKDWSVSSVESDSEITLRVAINSNDTIVCSSGGRR
jgi:hypothetical protein